jgi:hypothetical protein
MGSDGAESRDTASGAMPPAINPPAMTRRPLVLDAEFRVLSPARGFLRQCREYWWALGPYLAYCAALWGLAALIGWVV